MSETSNFSSGCSYSKGDLQEIGRSDIFHYGNRSPISNSTILGKSEFQSAGYNVDFGYLYFNDNLILAVGYPGMNVLGTYDTLPVNLSRAGSVILYNLSSTPATEVARFEGNRRYSGFGSLVKVKRFILSHTQNN